MAMTLLTLPQAPVWVLDDNEQAASSQALALAGRLGLRYLRVPASATWRRPKAPSRQTAWILDAEGGGPELVISAGARSGARALALRARFGSRLVHCSPRARALLPFDLMVRPVSGESPPRGRVLPSLGPLHVVSGAVLAEARLLWRERLAHLPHPLVALVLRTGGRRGLDPVHTGALVRRVASLAAARRGAVMVSAGQSIGTEALDAVAAALAPVLHVLYRTGEPGDDPTLGFLGSADAVVIGGASPLAISEAASADVPVFADVLGDRDDTGNRLLRTLERQGLVRALRDDFSPWPRRPLDETGRIAGEVRRILAL